IAVGMTYVILTGGIDLSVGAVVALAGVSAALAQPLGAPVMVAVAISVGLGVGIVNGALVTVGRVVPFIATLATLTIARGLALFVTNSQPIRITNANYIAIGAGRLADLIPYAVIIFVSVAVLGWFGLTRTTFGRRV